MTKNQHDLNRRYNLSSSSSPQHQHHRQPPPPTPSRHRQHGKILSVPVRNYDLTMGYLKRRLLGRSVKTCFLWTIVVFIVGLILLNSFDHSEISKQERPDEISPKTGQNGLCPVRPSSNDGDTTTDVDESSCPYYMHVQSGHGKRQPPLICLNSVNLLNFKPRLSSISAAKLAPEARTSNDQLTNNTARKQWKFNVPERFSIRRRSALLRGIHLVVLTLTRGGNLVQVFDHSFIFDTLAPNGDDQLIDFLAQNVTIGDFLLAATFGEVPLSAVAVGVLSRYFGSQSIQHFRQHDAFVMIGQKGAQTQSAIEQLRQKRSTEKFAPVAMVTACPKLPLSDEMATIPSSGAIYRQLFTSSEFRKINQSIFRNCGFEVACPSPETIPVFASSGVYGYKPPLFCINSQVAIGPAVFDGDFAKFNLAQYDPISETIVSHLHFSPYFDDFSALEIFFDHFEPRHLLLGMLYGGDSVGHERPEIAQLFSRFGVSSMSCLLQLGGVALVVGQLGSESAVERIKYPAETLETYWDAIELMSCIPKQISGLNPEPLLTEFGSFCYEKAETDAVFSQFCQRLGNSQVVSLNTDSSATDASDASYLANGSLPFLVVVMAGGDMYHLGQILEMVSQQLSVYLLSPNQALVTYSDSLDGKEVRQMIEIFGFEEAEIPSESYDQFYQRSLNQAVKAAKRRQVEFILLLEPDVSVGPDFLAFMLELQPSLDGSGGVFKGISGWNPFGYSHLSAAAEPDSFHVTGVGLPSPCFLVGRDFLEVDILSRYWACCSGRRFEPWSVRAPFIYPDVSRCFKTPPMLTVARSRLEAKLITDFYHQPRRTHMSHDHSVKRRQNLMSLGSYEKMLKEKIENSIIVEAANLHVGDYNEEVPCWRQQTDSRSVVFVFQQSNASDWSQFARAARCLGIYTLQNEPSLFHYGSFLDTLRVSMEEGDFFLVSSSSKLFNNRSIILEEKNKM